MDILGLIKDKLTDSNIKKVSNFLGEHPDNIGSALNSSVPIVLGCIIRSASNDEETGKVMDVLKDGGHTGEILDDLPVLLNNFEKTQLLLTIGTNIFNHFTGNQANGIVEKLSTFTGIRKTSAFSLVGLAAPLVLGALGKVVSKEGLGVSGLSKLLNEQREAVFVEIPPAIANQLNFKSSEPLKPVINKEEKSKENKNNSKDAGNRGFGAWIPWILIGFVFLGGVAYFMKYRRTVKPVEPVVNNTGLSTEPDSIAIDTTFSNIVPVDTASNLEPISTPNTDIPITTIEPKEVEKVKRVEKEVEEPKKEQKKVTLDHISVEDQLKNAKSWIALATDFKKNSAEVSAKTDLEVVVKFLKANRKAVVIVAGGSQSSKGTLGEDRAYAVRDVLIEKGVNEGQIVIQSSSVKEVDAKVVVKVK